ncbi:hypothetical protein PWY87_20110 [Kribbella solani]|uniref:hypothetical protein n=1 Tax=Kribbella solani TaxID=236067 RepID=UPI0029A8E24A|nr:hypothetical protein [Kribbella solani]MDX3004005.1 hypothetical protein [Kribbella solani]
MTANDGGVRPTKRCLTDLGRKFPSVNTPLSTVDHPLIEKAQQLPAEAQAGGAERVRSLTDRVWFKVKVTNHRGAATKLNPDDASHRAQLLTTTDTWWWICAAGERKSDSRTDFYKTIEAEAVRTGTGSGQVSTDQLLPGEIDFKRLNAEVALQAGLAIRDLTRRLIYESLTSGKVVTAEFSSYVLKACVRAREEAYLAIATEGFINPSVLAIILDAVPGVPHADWQVEPGGAMGVEVAYGQIVFSTIIPPATQAQIIELFADSND